MRVKGIIRGVVKILKSHETMAQPFIEKGDSILKTLRLLEKENLSPRLKTEIAQIFEKHERIQNFCIEKIKRATDHNFSQKNLFLFIFLYREINGVFKEAHDILHSGSDKKNPLSQTLPDLMNISEDRLTLAYLGDAALEIGVIPCIWPQPNPEKIPRKGFLHDERGKVIANKPLSQFWDSLKLYDPTILPPHPEDNFKNRGSSMEAVFGIIYLEQGQDAVEKSLHSLVEYYRTSLKMPERKI